MAVLLFPAPRSARRISRAPDRRALGRQPGVLAVDDVRGVGEPCAWQRGTDDAVATVWLTGVDHRELWNRFRQVAEYLGEAFGFADEHDRSYYERAARRGGALLTVRVPDAAPRFDD